LQAQETRVLAIAGTCGIPSDAKAVSFNATVTEATVQGHIRLFAAGEPLPNVSTVNYTAGLTRANNAITTLSAAGELAAFVAQASGTVHLIVDVNGYYK
jgi:hypothetical protein